MVTDDVGVGVAVEAVKGLVPEALEGTLTPGGMILGILGGGVLFQHVGHVHGAKMCVGLLPRPVKNAHLALTGLALHVLHGGDLTAQHVRGLPGVGGEVHEVLFGDGGVDHVGIGLPIGEGHAVKDGLPLDGDGDVLYARDGVDLTLRFGDGGERLIRDLAHGRAIRSDPAGQGDHAHGLVPDGDGAERGVARVGEGEDTGGAVLAAVNALGNPGFGAFKVDKFSHDVLLSRMQNAKFMFISLWEMISKNKTKRHILCQVFDHLSQPF